jgi:hypothetical protein
VIAARTVAREVDTHLLVVRDTIAVGI